MRHTCYFCHLRSVQELIDKFQPNEITANQFLHSVHTSLQKNWNEMNPLIATYTHRLAREILQVENLYAEEKENANTLLLENYAYWKKYIANSPASFETAAKLAVVGNIIDYGAHSLEGDLSLQIEELLKQPLILNAVDDLQKALKKAKSVLYLGDNAGEMVFDKLFIETIAHPSLIYVTRGKPVINDVTLDDAKRVGITDVCTVMTNGADAPSTLLPLCSDDFKEAYRNADLIISKGQGNFEGLVYEKHPNTFFMLIAKCQPIADLLHVAPKDLVITRF